MESSGSHNVLIPSAHLIVKSPSRSRLKQQRRSSDTRRGQQSRIFRKPPSVSKFPIIWRCCKPCIVPAIARASSLHPISPPYHVLLSLNDFKSGQERPTTCKDSRDNP
ncbi:hypothetical protein ACFX19_001660 [Malus domestica]